MARIHFICRDRLNLKMIEPPLYQSGYWSLSKDDAEKLKGGRIYLHQTKMEASYFGGIITNCEMKMYPRKGKLRAVFEFISDNAGRNVPWDGPNHDRSWTSGILD